MADTGVNAHSRSHLTATAELSSGRAVEGGVQHGVREVEPAVIQITPQAPYVGKGEVAGCVRISRIGTLIEHNRLSTIRVARAITRTGKRSLEEWLGRHCGCVGEAPSTGKARDAAAVLHHHIGIRVIEPLASYGHHVRYCVDVDRLVLVLNPAADITQLQGDSGMQLALNRKVDRVDDIGPEMRIQGLARTCGDAVDAREERLGQGRGGGRNRSCQAVNTDPESGVWGCHARAGAGNAVLQRAKALHRLD